ncbi:MAG TPA: diguanylate cyclase [Pyrinomonadaceae bacterium]|nr:diguanylate cyclase [Pyrinomonadaceae bacterium]
MKLDEKKITWQSAQDEIADRNGLAVVLVEGEDSSEICVSNNNSICGILYNSAKFAPRCAEYCGRAFQIAHEAGKPVHVKCHADLNFLTVPLETKDKKFAAIVGRAFLKSEDYRRATERAAAGDWQRFPAEEFFANVLISGSTDELEKAARQIEKLGETGRGQLNAEYGKPQSIAAAVGLTPEENSPRINTDEHGFENKEGNLQSASEISNLKSQSEKQKADSATRTEDRNLQSASEILDLKFQSEDQRADFTAKSENRNAQDDDQSQQIEDRFRAGIGDAEEAASWRSFFGSLLDLEYKNACLSLLDFLTHRYGVRHLAWLERRQNHLDAVLASGKFYGQSIQIRMSAEDERLLEVLRKETALELRQRKTENGGGNGNGETQGIWLFPVAVGGEIRGGLVVGGGLATVGLKRDITRFIRRIAPQIEILRLREELKRQTLLSGAAQKFNESLHQVETEDFWTHLAQFCAELMRAERGSLLFFDEETQKFTVKAATGNRAGFIRAETETLGLKVAQNVFQSGQPLLVPNIKETRIPPAPLDWKYKTDSFISYPITINGQKIGVLNVTDKATGGVYDDFDLELLHSLAPQLSVAFDRAALKRKAGEYEQLSVTDGLTGLYNRRYLEARLAEEINRSQRHGFPMSFMMIDVDEFKPYNDRFGHTEGDKALQIVAHCLKATLRGADVAARYGGEEFSILLPQTNLKEASLIAERVRQRVEESAFPNRKVTVSIGVSSCTPECTSEGLKSEADKALYKAKASGRNNVQIHEEAKVETGM